MRAISTTKSLDKAAHNDHDGKHENVIEEPVDCFKSTRLEFVLQAFDVGQQKFQQPKLKEIRKVDLMKQLNISDHLECNDLLVNYDEFR